MDGENFVSLKGSIAWPELKTVGERNAKLFKGKLIIPIGERKQYLKIAAWDDVAEALYELPKDSFINIHGHIEERSYNGSCKKCGEAEKKYWTEVVVDNFAIIS